MLNIVNVRKTFNKGTINEKKALDYSCITMGSPTWQKKTLHLR